MIEASLPLQCCWFESQQEDVLNLGIQWQPEAGELQISHTPLINPPINSVDVLWEGTQASTTGVELVGSQQRISVVVRDSSCVNV